MTTIVNAQPTIVIPSLKLVGDIWNKNGDHPNDYVGDTEGLENGEMRTFSGEYRKERDWEGSVVRRYRHPNVPGTNVCAHCGETLHDHGWIDKEDQEVCPGDVILTIPQLDGTLRYTPIKQKTLNAVNALVLIQSGAAVDEEPNW
jgi:hypothetical protein